MSKLTRITPYVNEGIVVVTEWEAREVAVQVEHHIAINVNEIIASAFLFIDEALRLVRMVQAVRL